MNTEKEPRRLIVDGTSTAYKKKLLAKARDRYGSLRRVSFALGVSTSVVHRWNNNEQDMGEKWVIMLEKLLL